MYGYIVGPTSIYIPAMLSLDQQSIEVFSGGYRKTIN